MNKELIIQMAREAGFDAIDLWGVWDAVERFFQLATEWQQAKDAEICHRLLDPDCSDRYNLGIAAAGSAIIRGEALAEQPAQQKPAAWLVEFENGEQELHFEEQAVGETNTPLYTTPPQRTWVGLTDEDVEAAMPSGIYDCLADPWDCGVGDGDEMRSIKKDVVRIARAIEAAHGIKENT